MNYEKKAFETEITTSRQELEQVRSVQKQKLDTLQTKMNNGQDAVKAMKWLQDNRDQFSGQVYDPIMMGIDVIDAANNAKYFKDKLSWMVSGPMVGINKAAICMDIAGEIHCAFRWRLCLFV